jgi:uncharacterized membrane protein YkvA (DUF1232 family)
VLSWFNKLYTFVKDVCKDDRIPERDKVVLGSLIALIVSPVDIIPDWIPIVGQLDDIVMIALVLDYLFGHLDETVLLSHYPWGMKSYARVRRCARIMGLLAPGFLKRRIWAYVPSPYGK